jgi:hypothetical protein
MVASNEFRELRTGFHPSVPLCHLLPTPVFAFIGEDFPFFVGFTGANWPGGREVLLVCDANDHSATERAENQ